MFTDTRRSLLAHPREVAAERLSSCERLGMGQRGGDASARQSRGQPPADRQAALLTSCPAADSDALLFGAACHPLRAEACASGCTGLRSESVGVYHDQREPNSPAAASVSGAAV